MTEAIEDRATTKSDQWRERLAEQERSGPALMHQRAALQHSPFRTVVIEDIHACMVHASVFSESVRDGG